MREDKCWYVYMVRCRDGSLYTGVARDPDRRLAEHNGVAPGGARYTRARRPVELVYTEAVPDRASACRREAALKRLRRPAKLALVRAAPR
jgi:putative endonuclease